MSVYTDITRTSPKKLVHSIIRSFFQNFNNTVDLFVQVIVNKIIFRPYVCLRMTFVTLSQISEDVRVELREDDEEGHHGAQ